MTLARAGWVDRAPSRPRQPASDNWNAALTSIQTLIQEIDVAHAFVLRVDRCALSQGAASVSDGHPARGS